MDLEYTPSVYFPDRTANKTNLSAELFFDLTCTAQKQGALPVESIMPNFINLSPKAPPQLTTKIKTEEFFQEFENNFVVTFEDDRLPEREDLAKTATFQLGMESQYIHSRTTDVTQMQRRESFGEEKQPIRMGLSLVHTAPIEEKGSPVAFQVKKRTVFKAKENIFSQAQNCKLTKKKIFNQNIFEEFAGRSKACPLTTAHAHNSQNSLPSHYYLRSANCPPSHTGFSLERHTHPSVCLQRRSKDKLRSATLNNWRKKFSRERKAMEGTTKRQNIFHVLLVR